MTDLVLITGFGPFAHFRINASWEAVKNLRHDTFENENIELDIRQLSVDYNFVTETVPQILREKNPSLCIYVGVHGAASKILLENRAFATGYTLPDVSGHCPPENCCLDKDGPSELCTNLNLKAVADRVNESFVNGVVELSDDPGRFLCGFTYYMSLKLAKCPSVFIHIPNTDICDSNTATKVLKAIIPLLIDQVRNLKGTKET